MGLSPSALSNFLQKNAEKKENGAYNKLTGKKYLPVFLCILGVSCRRIKEIAKICADWGIILIEDAAESLVLEQIIPVLFHQWLL